MDVDPLQLNVAVATLPWKSHLGSAAENKGVRLNQSDFQRISAAAIPPSKLCGVYVNSVMAKLASHRKGFDEALFVDSNGLVCECTGENVFAIFGDHVVAVEHPDALEGITRDTVIHLTNASSRKMPLAELLMADEIFLTGTSAEIAPVTEIDGHSFKIGAKTQRLQRLYQDIVHGKEHGRDGWLTWAA